MSITAAVTERSTSRFVIPCAGKMFRSSIEGGDKALCFLINKGYFETKQLPEMLEIIDAVSQFDDLILVGEVEKVRLNRTRQIVYRQRIFTKSLNRLCAVCEINGVRVNLASQFKVTINNIMNCREELPYLERYAKQFGETIDEWLTHCCIIELHNYFQSRNIATNMGSFVNRYLDGRVAYLHRAPFLISSYNISKHSSSVFLGFEAKDKRLYADEVTGIDLLKYGYTRNNVEADVKAGLMRKAGDK